MTAIFISSDPGNLKRALSQFQRTATVEAEYGETVIRGSVYTMAHHGSRKDNLCPCLHSYMCITKELNVDRLNLDAIGISHIDLDTIGGIMALLNEKPTKYNYDQDIDTDTLQDVNPDFWKAAAYVDTNGPHRLHECSPTEETEKQLWAFWAWSEKNRIYAPRDGSALDVTKMVMNTIFATQDILDNDNLLLDEGAELKDSKERLERSSYRANVKGILIRESTGPFVNSLYKHLDKVHEGIASFNRRTGAITLSLEHPISGVSCRDVVQFLWGLEAGGHNGIAGSPRGWQMKLRDAYNAALVLSYALYKRR